MTLDASVWIAGLDMADRFHLDSVHFFSVATMQGWSLFAPTFALVEVGCAVARRKGDGEHGRRALERIRSWSQLTLVEATRYLPDPAAEVGISCLLRGSDATYAATARVTGTRLVTWDRELIERAGGMTPTDWLAANP